MACNHTSLSLIFIHCQSKKFYIVNQLEIMIDITFKVVIVNVVNVLKLRTKLRELN